MAEPTKTGTTELSFDEAETERRQRELPGTDFWEAETDDAERDRRVREHLGELEERGGHGPGGGISGGVHVPPVEKT